jgi:TatD family-associated radical SAM protein
MKTGGSVVYWRNNSLYLNITNRCPNNCVFCVRQFQDGVFGFNLLLKKEPTIDEIISSFEKNYKTIFHEVVFTGFGEPFVRLSTLCSVAKEISRSLSDDCSIRIDTCGLAELLHPQENIVNKLRKTGITKLSISLNAENKEKYQQICRSIFGSKAYPSLLSFAQKCKEFFSVEFTVVAIPQIDILGCKLVAKKMGIPLRIRSYSGPPLVFE